MASLEQCIKCSWNLIWRGKREFLSFNLTSEVWVQRWVIPQHNKVAQPSREKKNKKSGSDNMKQNLEKNLQLTLLTKHEKKGGSWRCPWNNGHFLRLKDCWETPSSSPGGTNPPPGRTTWQVLRTDYATSQMRPRLLEFKSHFWKKVGSTGSLSGG